MIIGLDPTHSAIKTRTAKIYDIVNVGYPVRLVKWTENLFLWFTTQTYIPTHAKRREVENQMKDVYKFLNSFFG